MSQAPEFPAFVKIQYGPNGAASSAFMADLDRMFGNAEQKFKAFSAEAQTQLDAALSVSRNAGGSLDLGVPQLEAAAKAQQARATAAREVAAATRLAAKEIGDESTQARLAIRATEALAKEEERAAAAARSHAAAATQVQERLNRQASATDMVVQATRRGAEAQTGIANSSRSSRFAFIQLGQQMQDITVQAQMGTNAFIIFGQQVPQAAFALSGLAGSANKVEAAVGRVATFLAGPWGAAVFVAVAVLGPFIAKMLDFGAASDEANSKAYDFSRGLDVLSLSAKQTTDAMKQLADATRGAIAIQGDFLNQQKSVADQAVGTIQSRIDAKTSERNKIASNPDDYWLYGVPQLKKLDADIATDRQSLLTAKAAAANADLAVSQRKVLDGLDPVTAATNRYNDAIGKLNQQRKATIDDPLGAGISGKGIDAAHYETEFKRLTKIKNDAVEAARKTGSTGQSGREINLAEAKSIAEQAGYKITSAGRPAWMKDEVPGGPKSQERLFNTVRSPTNPVAKPGTGAHEYGRENALDIAFAPGISLKKIEKTYADMGVRLKKKLIEDGHFHIEWTTSGADKVDREAERIQKEAERLAEAQKRHAERLAQFGAAAAEHIARVNEQFNVQPRLIDQANAAARDLDKTIAELSERKPIGFEQMIADAQAAKIVIQDALVRPFQELTRDSQRRLDIEILLTQGREDEANALQTIWQLEQRIGPLKREQKDAVLDQVKAERLVTEELRRRQDVIAMYLDATRSVKQELVSIFSGTGSIGNIKNIFKQLNSQVLVEKLFGGAFRDLDKWLKGQSGLSDSVDYFASETDRASTAAGTLADALNSAAAGVSSSGASGDLNSQFDSVFGGKSTGGGSMGWAQVAGLLGIPSGAANDNSGNGEIVVTAPRGSINSLTPQDYFRRLTESITHPLTNALEPLLGKRFAGQLGGVISGGLNGYLTAGPAGGILGALQSIPGLSQGRYDRLGKGLAGAQTGSLVAGIGNSLGIKLNNNGAQIGGAIGGLTGIPGGQIIGSLLGGLVGTGKKGTLIGAGAGLVIGGPIGAIIGALIGSAFNKKPRGSGSVSGGGVTASANDKTITTSLNDFGGAIQTSLANLAAQFGGSVGNYDVGIGRYKDYYQVSGKSGDPKLGNSYFGRDSASALYDGKDAEAAMRAAILNAIQDGAIKGISEGAKRLLAAGKNIEAQVAKALEFQGVFTKLRQLTDPVGAALEALNKEFSHLKDVFKEAGASTEEYAKLEQLYGIQRAEAIKQATEQLTGSLRSLYDELTVGNDALSLRDRKGLAQAKYDPLAARVAAGDTTAYGEFADAARILLGIERSLSGSQSDYFALNAQVTALTKGELDRQQGLIGAAIGSDSPFSTTSATAAANDNQSVVSAISDSNSLLTAINENLIAVIQQAQITNPRGFAPANSVSYY